MRINIVTSINFNVLNSWTIRVQFWRKLQITISTIVSFLSSNRHIFINTAPFLTVIAVVILRHIRNIDKLAYSTQSDEEADICSF